MEFVEQVKLEWRIQLRRPFVWFCLFGFFAIAWSDTFQAGLQGNGNLWINGAAAICNRAIIYSLLGVIAVVGIMADPFVRDTRQGVDGLVLAKTGNPLTLGLARFVASFSILCATTCGIALGMIMGAMAPGIPAESVGPLVWTHYGFAIAILILPNYLLISALVYWVASRSKSSALAFLTGGLTIACWVTFKMLLGRDVYRQDWFAVFAILDPFASIASSEYLIKMTVAQQNEQFVPFAGLLLWNRLSWVGLAVGGIILTTFIFPIRQRLLASKTRKRNSQRESDSRAIDAVGSFKQSQQIRRRSSIGSDFWHIFCFDFRRVIRFPATWITLLMLGICLWWAAASAVTYQFSLPSTDLLIHNTNYYFDKTLILALAWIASELIAADRELNTLEAVDSQPFSSVARYLAKTAVMICVVFVFWIFAIGINISYQFYSGYYEFELSLYLLDSLVFKMPYYFFMALLAISVQSIFNNRWIGLSVTLLIYVLEVLLTAVGIIHPIFLFGRVSHFWYSNMDGYGHFWPSHFWMLGHWLLGSILVWQIGLACQSRGTHSPTSYQLFRSRLHGTRSLALFFNAVAFLILGGVIWYLSGQHAGWPPISTDRMKATIEKAYGDDWRNQNQPVIDNIEIEIDLYPAMRQFSGSGSYRVKNVGNTSIDRVLVIMHPKVVLDTIQFDLGATKESENKACNVTTWKLDQPLLPNQNCGIQFEISSLNNSTVEIHSPHDDVPEVSGTQLVENGTSILNLRILPAIGYTDRVELKPDWKRKKYGVPARWQPPVEVNGLEKAHGTLHLQWVESLVATIRTAADQVAIHAGILESSWTETDGRRGFKYRVEGPSRGWSNLVSGRYSKHLIETDDLPDIEIYYHAPHRENAIRFGNELQEAMRYFSKRYGSPPFQVFRLAENALHYDGFGCRNGFAVCSEILGWKSDMRVSRGKDIERLAALMMAFSWWGDQVIPANIEGAKVIHSGLPFWTASLYLESKRSGAEGRAIRLQELMDLYRERGMLEDEEGAFVTEFKNSKMIQKKGTILILHLADLIGLESLEKVFAEFLKSNRYQNSPYPTAVQLIAKLKEGQNAATVAQIDDVFSNVTTWDLAIKNASMEPIVKKGNRQRSWMVKMDVEAAKFYTEGLGNLIETDVNTEVTLAAFNSNQISAESQVFEKRVFLNSGLNHFEFQLDQKPVQVTIDPYLKLIDANPYDNARILNQ